MVTKPAGCGICAALWSRQFGSCGLVVKSVVGLQPGGGDEASTAPSVLKSTPADAVVSFETIVLFWTVTPYHVIDSRLYGGVTTSVPLTCCRRRPPPLPLSALLPMIRFESIMRFAPVPSPSPGGQSATSAPLHSLPFGSVRTPLAPMIPRPPPLVGSVASVLWLNRM